MPLEYTSLKNSSWSIRDDESLMVISCNRDLELWEGGGLKRNWNIFVGNLMGSFGTVDYWSRLVQKFERIFRKLMWNILLK